MVKLYVNRFEYNDIKRYTCYIPKNKLWYTVAKFIKQGYNVSFEEKHCFYKLKGLI